MAAGEKRAEFSSLCCARELHTRENTAGLIGFDALFYKERGSHKRERTYSGSQ